VDNLGKKILLFLIMCVLLFSLGCPVWAASEDDFWLACRQGDYMKAGDLAKGLGSTIPAYYSLAAVCYQNNYMYDLCRIYKNKFQQHGNPESLKELFAEKQNEYPDDPQLLLLQSMAAILFPGASLGDAGVLLGKAATKLTDNPYLCNYQALNELNKQNFSAVVQKNLQKAITLKKDYPEPYINLAMVYAQNKETDKAIAVLLDCFNNCPRVPDNAYQNLINLVSIPVNIIIKPYGQQMTVSVPNMKEIYRQKIKTGLSKTPLHLLALAEIFAVKGNITAARNLTNDMVFTNNSLNGYLQLQMANFDGNFEQAVQISQTLINSNDLNYQRLYETGNILFYGKEFKLAIAFYESALKGINPDDDEYLIKVNTNMGICSYLSQEYQKALDYLEKVLTCDPHDANALVYSGLAYRDLGDKVKAVEYLTKALEYIHDAEWRQEITGIVNELKPEDKEIQN
jgi:tetratricopeptide (TPR) repeat protein